jgi:hypothetical protein
MTYTDAATDKARADLIRAFISEAPDDMTWAEFISSRAGN